MSVPRRRRSLPAKVLAVAAAALAGLTLAGVLSSPASADDGNSGTIDTSRTTVTTQGDQGGECTGTNPCKRINWCDKGDKAPERSMPLSADAPMVELGTSGRGEPACIKKPKMSYKCCVPDKTGTANIDIKVTNTNGHKLLVRIHLDDSGPLITKWVDGNSTATFSFHNVANGKHVIHNGVWVGGKTWCTFGDKEITVKCAKPSATPSQSHSPSPSPVVTTSAPGGTGTTPTVSKTPELPVTGPSNIQWVAMVGGAMFLAGIVAVVVFRRRRNQVQFIT